MTRFSAENETCEILWLDLWKTLIFQEIDHPCVIRLEDVVDTDQYLYIVLELADGGELFDKIVAKTKLDEDEAKLMFYQVNWKTCPYRFRRRQLFLISSRLGSS